MRPLFPDPPIINDADQIGISDGAQPVRNDHGRCEPANEDDQSILNQHLGHRISVLLHRE